MTTQFHSAVYPPSYLIPCRALAFPPRFLYNKEAAIFSIVSVIFFCTFQKDTMKARRIWYAAKAKTELPACPVETTLTLIGDKWKVLILRDLMPGTKRFGELKKSIGTVTQKVLTAQLRQMEASGLLTRTVYAEVPPRVEYTLTDLGRSLRPVLDAMEAWGKAYQENAR